MREHGRDLKRAHYSAAGDVGRPLGGDVAAIVDYSSGSRLEKLCQQVEYGRLAGAIWTDQRVNGPAADLEIHPVNCGKAAELLGKAAGLEDQVVQAQSRHDRPRPVLF